MRVHRGGGGRGDVSAAWERQTRRGSTAEDANKTYFDFAFYDEKFGSSPSNGGTAGEDPAHVPCVKMRWRTCPSVFIGSAVNRRRLAR